MAADEPSVGRLIFKLVLKFVVPLVVVLSFIPGPNGQPIISWSDWLPDKQLITDAKKMLGKAPIKDNPFSNTSSKKTIYKWKDEHGRWQFSQDPPRNIATKAETFTVSANINTMAAPTTIDTNNDNTDTIKMHEIDKPAFPLPTTISPMDIPKLIENTKNIQKIMDQRNKNLEGR